MEIEQFIKDTISKAQKSGFSMNEEDMVTFSKIAHGESTYDDVIIPDQKPEKLKMWLTLRKWEREKFAFPSLYYDYKYGVIMLRWPQGKEDCVFRSISEEKAVRDKWSLEAMIRKNGVEGVARNWILMQTDPYVVKSVLHLTDEELKNIVQDIKTNGIALSERYSEYL